jgi:hypothetical protein
LRVLDVRPANRHLLLELIEVASDDQDRRRFLCGHDERHWFVAAVPERARAGDVRAAMDALKPSAVRDAERSARLKRYERYRRKNRAFLRQGEWFFIPEPQLRVDPRQILQREPLRRGGGKPHWAEYCWRTGGQTVYVSDAAPNGLTAGQLERWRKRHPDDTRHWVQMQRDAEVYVRGKIRHPDHATIRLAGWHRVEMNTEHLARGAEFVAFLD